MNEEFWDDLYQVDAADLWLNSGYDEDGEAEEDVTELRPIDLGVEYFKSAKASLERAEKYDPMNDGAQRQEGEHSVLYDTFKYLHAYKQLKSETFFGRHALFLAALVAGLLIWGYWNWETYGHPFFLAQLIAYIVVLASIPIFFILIISIPRCFKWVFTGKAKEKMTVKMAKAKLGDAEKLLCYYRLWRTIFSKAINSGYEVSDNSGYSLIPQIVVNFDWVLEHMEALVKFVREN